MDTDIKYEYNILLRLSSKNRSIFNDSIAYFPDRLLKFVPPKNLAIIDSSILKWDPVEGKYNLQKILETKHILLLLENSEEYSELSRLFRRSMIVIDKPTLSLPELSQIIQDFITSYKNTSINLLQQSAAELSFENSFIKTFAKIGTFHLDLISKKIVLSKEFQYLLGLTPIKKSYSLLQFMQFISVEDRDKMLDILFKEINGKTRDINDIIKFTHQTKNIIYISIDGAAKTLSKQNSISYLAQDISEKINAEVELKSTEKFYSSLIENSSELVIMLNKSAEIIYANKAVEKLLGFSPLEFLGMPIIDFLEEKERTEDLQNLFFDQAETGKTGSFRMFKIKDKNNQEKLLGGRATNHLNNPSINGVVLQFHDFTESITYKKEIEQQEARYTNLFNYVKDAIIITDKKGNVIEANKYAKILFRNSFAKNNNVLSLFIDEKQKVLSSYYNSSAPSKNLNVDFEFKTNYLNKTLNVQLILFKNLNFDTNFLLYISDITKLEKKRLYEESTLNISHIINRKTLDTNILFKSIHNEIKTVIEASNFYYARFEPENNIIKYLYLNDLNNNSNHDKLISRNIGKGISEIVFANQKPLRLHGDAFTQLAKELKGSEIYKSYLGVPLFIKGKIDGVLAVSSRVDNHVYNDDDERFLQYVSNQLGNLLERIQTINTLVLREAEYRTLVENNLAGIYTADKNLVIKSCNQAFCEIMGAPKDQLIGKKTSDFVIKGGIENFYDEVSKNGNIVNSQRDITLQNGKHLNIVENISIVNLNNEKLVMGNIIDVSTTRELQLKVSQENKTRLSFQAKLFGSLINPHFIFNSLNSIQYYILEQDRYKALTYLADFSTLMRSALNNTQKLLLPIADELSFLESYIKLEQVRLFNFEYNIIDETEEEYLIPPMMLQPYVENAIVHGIYNLKEKGKLTIRIIEKKNSLICSIEDNGIGRKKGAELRTLKKGKTHRSFGMSITKERINTLNELFGKNKFTVSIIDKKNDISGTIVSVSIPKLLNYDYQTL